MASIALVGGSAGSPPIEGQNGAPPTIYAEPSQIQNIIDTLQNLSGKVDGLIARADSLVADNTQSITDTLRNVDKFSAAFAENTDGVKDFLSSVGAIGRDIKPFVEALNRTSGPIDDTAKNVAELAEKLNRSADKIDGVLAAAQGFLGQPGTAGAMDDIGGAARAIRKLAENLDGRTKELTAGFNRLTGQGLRSINGLVSDGRRAVEQVDRTTRSVEKNPQQFIFGAKPTVPEYSPR